MRGRSEAGFTLLEVLVVAAIVAIAAGTLGTFFLAGASPAVASASRDVTAAFDEARRAAIAFDAATVAFVPAQSGSGYSARVYRRFPGDPQFAARNGPSYDSTVAISETAAPLGAPGFAFAIDAHGNVTGFANFAPDAASFSSRPCPASGAFALQLVYERDTRTIAVPCRLPLSAGAPAVAETPAPAWISSPAPAATCPNPGACSLALVTPPPGGAACPPGYTADAADTGLCDAAAAPTPAPPSATCPPGYSGTPPLCAVDANPPPAPTPSPAVAGCVPGAPDAAGFASCLDSDPIRILGNAITHTGCGTRTPIADPGPSFSVTVEISRDGNLWGTYAVVIVVGKAPWLEQTLPPSQTCGLLFALNMGIASVAPLSGNATGTPYQDTGDPALAQQGVGAILNPTVTGGWGSDS